MLAKKLQKVLPTVVIVGRTNVGKSTLFNCLLEKKRAIVSDIPGTTRDVNIGQVDWQRRSFQLIDTGGFLDLSWLANKKQVAATIDEKVQKQARDFLTRADLILFVVDNKDGLLAQDKQMSGILKKILPSKDKVVLVANKVDSQREAAEAASFWQLDWGEPQTISAASGASTGDLLDLVIKKLTKQKAFAKKATADEPPAAELIKVCILGKPNVGKSSLLNAILGYERVIVSPIPHTTREPQDTEIVYRDRPIKLVDTAGINRKWRDAQGLEKLGIAKSLEVLDEAEIALLVLDINEPLTKQETKLVEEIFARRKSLIILANKWDLIDKRDTKTYSHDIYRVLPFAQFAPIIFLSAKKRTKIAHLLDLILTIADNRRLELGQKELDRFIKTCITKHKPTKGKGAKYPRLYYFSQTGTNPPEFMARIGASENLAESYLGFLANQLRDKYNLTGTPIKIWIKK